MQKRAKSSQFWDLFIPTIPNPARLKGQTPRILDIDLWSGDVRLGPHGRQPTDPRLRQ